MAIDRMVLGRARVAQRAIVGGFLYQENVDLIDIGFKDDDRGNLTDELAVRVHVHEKLPKYALEAAVESGRTRAVPKELYGVRTDVVESNISVQGMAGWGGWGSHRQGLRARRTDPMTGGISISSERQYGYGTLGGLVRDRETGDEMLLSVWHVVAGDWWARPGQRIYQPGWADGGQASDTVATLTRDAMADGLDAAVAKLSGGRRLTSEQLGLGSVRGVRHGYLGMHVVKSGRKTDITEGRVTGFGGVQKMSYAGLTRRIVNVITIDPWTTGQEVSAGGDSGALWLDKGTHQAVGLHFAGSNYPERALAIDLPAVLAALNVNLVI